MGEVVYSPRTRAGAARFLEPPEPRPRSGFSVAGPRSVVEGQQLRRWLRPRERRTQTLSEPREDMSRLALIVVLSLPAASGTPTGWATFAIPAEGGMSGLPFQDFGSTGSWTAELWIKMDSDMFTKTIPPFGVMPFGLHEGSNHAGLTMYQAGTGVCGNTCTGGFSPHVWCSGLFPSCICEADTWVHFAAVKDSSANSLTIYRDGVQDTQRSWSGTTCQGVSTSTIHRLNAHVCATLQALIEMIVRCLFFFVACCQRRLSTTTQVGISKVPLRTCGCGASRARRRRSRRTWTQ